MGCVTPNCPNYTVTVQPFTTTNQTVNVVKPVNPPPTDTVVIPTGLNEQYAGTTLMVYPNPLNQILNVEFKMVNYGVTYDIKIVDLPGKEVLHSSLLNSKTEIDASYLNAGIYFLQLRREGKIIATRKIMKE